MKHLGRKFFSFSFFFALAGFVFSGGVFAQSGTSYPVKPIRVIVGFAPGGPADIAGRLVMPKVSEVLGQQLLLESRGGAGGTIGMEAVAKAPKDGYTLGLGSSGNLVVAPNLYQKVGYNVAKDIVPVSSLATTAFVIAVNPTVPVKNTQEFVKLAKSRKEALTFGSSGNGSSSHIAGELFRTAIGAEFLHVPYKGTGPSLVAVVSGEIDMMFADLIPVLPHAKSGRLRLISTLGKQRPIAAPDLPTIAEGGVKMQPISGRYAIVAPAGTPREIIMTLNEAFSTVLRSTETQKLFVQSGFEVASDTPDQLAAILKNESDVIGGVIRKAGIRAD